MTATTKDIDHGKLGPLPHFDTKRLVVKTGETIYQGSLCGLDVNGELVAATAVAGQGPYYRAEESVKSAAAGAKIQVSRGAFYWTNGDSIGNADIGSTAFAADNQTVQKASGGVSPVGQIVDYDSVNDLVGVDHFAVAGAGGIIPSQLASGYRAPAADAALTLADDDRTIQLISTDAATKAATMTATHAGHRVTVVLDERSSTGSYTLGCDYGAATGDVTLDAAGEGAELVYTGSAWELLQLIGGATFA